MKSEPGTTQRGLAILAWTLFLAIGLTLWVRSQGLKWVQGVIWPTDIHTFSQMEESPIDVVILGSSRASFAVSPSALDTCLSERLQRNTTSFNLARTFATARSAQILAEELLVGQRTPKVLVLAIGPDFFDEQNPSRAAEIDAHHNLEDIPQALWEAGDLTNMWAALRPLGHGMERSALFLSGRHDTDDHLRWMMMYHGGGQFCFGSNACEQNNQAVKDVLAGRWDTVMSRIDEITDERYQHYQLKDGSVHDHLLTLLAWAERHEVAVVIAETPLHEAWQSRIPGEVWTAYQAHLSALESEYGIQRFQSTAPGWAKTRKRFIDPDHLSDAGSKRFTAELCTALVPLVEK